MEKTAVSLHQIKSILSRHNIFCVVKKFELDIDGDNFSFSIMKCEDGLIYAEQLEVFDANRTQIILCVYNSEEESLNHKFYVNYVD